MKPKRLERRGCDGGSRIHLDTLADMQAAQRLYASLGFRPIPAYVFNPIAGAKFMELALTGPGVD